MRVFLTGGTGLLGSHVAVELGAAGHDVVALVRNGSDASRLEGRAEVRRGDVLEPPGRLREHIAGCEAVVHAAALLYRRGVTDSDYERVNVGATEAILTAASTAGAERAVLVSSIAVYGGDSGGAHAEDTWLAEEVARGASYARSKRAAEIVGWRLHEAGAVRLTVVRPGVLYGERDRLFTPLLAQVTRWPVLPLPEGGRHTVPVVYAGNVARGIVQALERATAVGRAYNLSDDGPLTVRALVASFSPALGRSPVLVSVPRLVGVAASWLTDVVARAIPGAANAPRVVRRLLEDNSYPSERARRELDWTVERLVPHDEALARTAAWWRSTHPERVQESEANASE